MPEGQTPSGIPFEVVRQIELPVFDRGPRASKYPVWDLGVNDALVTTHRGAKNIGVAARAFAKRNPGTKFITRSLGDGRSAVVRIS